MVSSSPTRLASCSQAALSMLSQGLLHWQHLYIPVMPPHLWQYHAAPYPYLIGILSSTLPRLERTDGLGEVLIIHLDSNSMETRGIDAAVVDQWIPDMFQSMQGDKGSSTSAAASPIEYLGQDLLEILKEDKKALYGDSTLATMGETAAKATKVVKSTFKKLRDKGRQYLQKNTSMPLSDKEEEEEEEAHEAKSMADDYIFTESCHNASAEEEARVSFTSFFLCMFGNMRWYLSANPGQQLPVLDRERFLQQKRSMGEGEGTPIWPLLKNFCQTQMLEEFAKARIEEVRLQKEATPDAPLFVQCSSYHRQHNVDFGLLNVRKVARQLAQGNKLRNAAVLQSNARRTVMSLTSNKVYEGDYNKTVAQVVEECRESTTILFDVMSVLWLRLRDCKGMQWKHGFQALLILRNLLYHGPVAVIAEATDGLDKIRAIKYYDNMRPQIVSQMRNAATDVYGLLVDRGRLFHIRRICAHRRLRIHNPAPKTSKRTGLTIGVPFRRIHAELHPQAQGTIVRLPTPATASQPVQSRNHQPLAMSPEDTASVFGNMNITSLSPTAAIPQPTVAQPPTNTMPTSQQSFVSQGNPFSVGPQTQAGRVQQVPPAIQPNSNQFDPFAR